MIIRLRARTKRRAAYPNAHTSAPSSVLLHCFGASQTEG